MNKKYLFITAFMALVLTSWGSLHAVNIVYGIDGEQILDSDSPSLTALINNPVTLAGSSGTVGDTLTVSLSGGSVSGVTYSTSSANCSVTSLGAVTATSAGTCSVSVSIPADSTYLAFSDSADYVFTAALINNPVVLSGSSGTLPSTLTVSLVGGSTTGVTYSTSSANCSVSNAGVVTATSSGTCSVSVSIPADSTYLAFSGSADYVFAAALITNPVTVAGSSGTVGDSLTVSLSGGSTTGVTYSTSSANCSVSNAGAVTATAAGTCSVSVSIPADSTYLAYSGSADYVFAAAPADNFLTTISSADVVIKTGNVACDAGYTKPTLHHVTSGAFDAISVSGLKEWSSTYRTNLWFDGGHYRVPLNAGLSSSTVTIAEFANIAVNTPISSSYANDKTICVSNDVGTYSPDASGCVINSSSTALSSNQCPSGKRLITLGEAVAGDCSSPGGDAVGNTDLVFMINGWSTPYAAMATGTWYDYPLWTPSAYKYVCVDE